MSARPTLLAAFFALVCIGFIVAALFFIDGTTNRLIAGLFGLHFGNRCEIENLRRAMQSREAY